jgi:prepilin-type N-terminal cleavage/methylation domain-containing protein
MSKIRQNMQYAMAGFTLLELSIVLVIIAVIIAGSLQMSGAKAKQNELKVNYNQMKIITDALSAHARIRGLPCPAPIAAVQGTNTFGQEADLAAAGTCSGTGAVTGIQRMQTPSGDWVRIGTVPVYALGLSEELMSDPWNNRYIYMVDESLILKSCLALSGMEGDIEIYDQATVPAGGNRKLDNAAFVIISLGPSGKGGTNFKSGAANDDGCDAANLDGENCDYTTDAKIIKAPFNNGSVAASFFDDFVMWKTRANIVAGSPDCSF